MIGMTVVVKVIAHIAHSGDIRSAIPITSGQ